MAAGVMKRPGAQGGRVSCGNYEVLREVLGAASPFMDVTGEIRVDPRGRARLILPASPAPGHFVEIPCSDRLTTLRGGEGRALEITLGTEHTGSRARLYGHAGAGLKGTIEMRKGTIYVDRDPGPLSVWLAEQQRHWRQVRSRRALGAADFERAVQNLGSKKVLWVGREDLATFGDFLGGRLSKENVSVGEAPMSGPKAIPEITALLRGVDPGKTGLVVLGRGGGTVADLAIFNAAALIDAVLACPVPVVAAVGHTSDTPLVNDAAAIACQVPKEAGNRIRQVWARNSQSSAVRSHTAAPGRGPSDRTSRDLEACQAQLASVRTELAALSEELRASAAHAETWKTEASLLWWREALVAARRRYARQAALLLTVGALVLGLSVTGPVPGEVLGRVLTGCAGLALAVLGWTRITRRREVPPDPPLSPGPYVHLRTAKELRQARSGG